MSKDTFFDNFTTIVAKELASFIIGERIGGGVARSVYHYNVDSVIKVETGSQSFQNVREWENWLTLRDTPFGKRWLAPCLSISSCGIYLVQKKTSPPDQKFKWPERIPRVLTDRKRENFGILGSHLVCHDYGTLDVGLARDVNLERMSKSEW